MDILGLLNKVAARTDQPDDPGTRATPPRARTLFNLYRRDTSSFADGWLRADISTLQVRAVQVTAGQGSGADAGLPTLSVKLLMAGELVIKLGGFALATVAVRGQAITLAVSVKVDAAGGLAAVTTVPADLLDLNLRWPPALAAGVLGGPVLLLGVAGVTQLIENYANDLIVTLATDVVQGAMAQAPRILAMALGGYYQLQSVRADARDIMVDYLAPNEPDPKPSSDYNGAIGRDHVALQPGHFRFMPALGDTWAAGNLNKIEHIVVVVMENRSYDHVLGYRARAPEAHPSDGLSDALINSLGVPVRNLAQSDLAIKTKFAKSVGHHVRDVAQQLSQQVPGPGGVPVNSPQGFIANFEPKVADPAQAQGLVKEDVLGYYDGQALPFYGYLADHYATSDRYFCAHPGPTLPNRMFAVSGALQSSRSGEAIVDNNNFGNFLLSRANTVFDVLSRKGVGWRIYESQPSVTMLRMFARYAGDNTNIVDIARLQHDISSGNLPAVTMVEPAMHHFPASDDHPVADMLQGQLFLKNMHDQLSAKPELWAKTLLVITYDEHGGFYDHVVPPVADVRYHGPTAGQQTNGGSGSVSGSAAPAQTLFTPYGVRVPTFVVSPWVPAGRGPRITLDHCSILKTILARFCPTARPFLSDRVQASNSLNAFLTEVAPRMAQVPRSPGITPPTLGTAERAGKMTTQPISQAQMADGDLDYHDLTGMLARMLGRR